MEKNILKKVKENGALVLSVYVHDIGQQDLGQEG